MKTVSTVIFLSVLFNYCFCETIRVIGAIHCEKRINRNPIEVTLYDEDFSSVPIWNWFDSDDELNYQLLDYGQSLDFEGGEIEMFSIEPYLSIKSTCLGYPRYDRLDLSRFIRHGNTINIGRLLLKETGLEQAIIWNSYAKGQ